MCILLFGSSCTFKSEPLKVHLEKLQSDLFSSGSGSQWVDSSLEWTETGSDSEVRCGFCGWGTFISVGQFKGQHPFAPHPTLNRVTVFNLCAAYQRHLSHKCPPSFQTFCLGFFPDTWEMNPFLEDIPCSVPGSILQRCPRKKKYLRYNNYDFRSSFSFRVCVSTYIRTFTHTHKGSNWGCDTALFGRDGVLFFSNSR